MPAFLRSMFGLGKLPDDVRAQFEAEGVIDFGRNLGVITRFSGSVPGLHSGASISRTSGMLVLTSQRIVTTLAIRSDRQARAVDRRWDDPDVGATRVEISGDGVRLDLDVHRVDPEFQGHLSLHYKRHLSDDVLAQLPKTSVRQDVSADFVSRALGVRPKSSP